MTQAEHEATRTYGGKGAKTARLDANRAFKDVLTDDIKDVRKIVGSKYDASLEKLITHYEEKGLLKKGELKLSDICK